jgi:hypothetical protein
MIRKRIVMIWGVVLVAAFAAFVGCKKEPPQSETRQAQESKAESLDATSTFAQASRFW